MSTSDRGAWRHAARAFRPHRTIPAIVVAALLAAAAILTLVGAIAATAGSPVRLPALERTMGWAAANWADPATLVASSLACLAGLVLLGFGLIPGRPRLIPLASADPNSVVGITPGAARRHLASVADQVDGVSRARVRLGRRRLDVRVTTPLREPGDLPERVTATMEHHLEELAPLRPPRVRVDVRHRGH
ncbi:DUF6286 domain-containing protein [Sphaerisporangium aureirubrum]|uniref:DUF6286 domain-containing protein n=1 Tax=Sphaerisporangium aureirubrum TaxID=1544736 RepID=A0ABW1NIF9_9ACTN